MWDSGEHYYDVGHPSTRRQQCLVSVLRVKTSHGTSSVPFTPLSSQLAVSVGIEVLGDRWGPKVFVDAPGCALGLVEERHDE